MHYQLECVGDTISCQWLTKVDSTGGLTCHKLSKLVWWCIAGLDDPVSNSSTVREGGVSVCGGDGHNKVLYAHVLRDCQVVETLQEHWSIGITSDINGNLDCGKSRGSDLSWNISGLYSHLKNREIAECYQYLHFKSKDVEIY